MNKPISRKIIKMIKKEKDRLDYVVSGYDGYITTNKYDCLKMCKNGKLEEDDWCPGADILYNKNINVYYNDLYKYITVFIWNKESCTNRYFLKKFTRISEQLTKIADHITIRKHPNNLLSLEFCISDKYIENGYLAKYFFFK